MAHKIKKQLNFKRAMTRKKDQMKEAQIDAGIFFVLARMFPKKSDTEILDMVPDVKVLIQQYVWFIESI